MHVDTVQLDAKAAAHGYETTARRVVQNDGNLADHLVAISSLVQSPTGLPPHAVQLPDAITATDSNG